MQPVELALVVVAAILVVAVVLMWTRGGGTTTKHSNGKKIALGHFVAAARSYQQGVKQTSDTINTGVQLLQKMAKSAPPAAIAPPAQTPTQALVAVAKATQPFTWFHNYAASRLSRWTQWTESTPGAQIRGAESDVAAVGKNGGAVVAGVRDIGTTLQSYASAWQTAYQKAGKQPDGYYTTYVAPITNTAASLRQQQPQLAGAVAAFQSAYAGLKDVFTDGGS